MAKFTLKTEVKVTKFQTRQRPSCDIWFKFENKIPNYSKVIIFTRNHKTTTDDDDNADGGTKNNTGMSPLVGGGNGSFQDIKNSK